MHGTRNCIWNIGNFYGKISPDGEILGKPNIPVCYSKISIDCGFADLYSDDGYYISPCLTINEVTLKEGAKMWNTLGIGDNDENKMNRQILSWQSIPRNINVNSFTDINSKPTTWRSLSRDQKDASVDHQFTALRRVSSCGLDDIEDPYRLARFHDITDYHNLTPTQLSADMRYNYGHIFPEFKLAIDGNDDFGKPWNEGLWVNPLKIMYDYKCDGFFVCGTYYDTKYSGTHDEEGYKNNSQELFVIPSNLYEESNALKGPYLSLNITFMEKDNKSRKHYYYEKVGDIDVRRAKRYDVGTIREWMTW